MPELPEVQTIVDDLRKKVVGRKIVDIWTDWPKYFHPVRNPPSRQSGTASAASGRLISNGVNLEAIFRKHGIGKKITGVERMAKNIIFDLSDNHLMLIHQKMSGHLLYGKWRKINGVWQSTIKGPLLEDRNNQYIRLIFFFDPVRGRSPRGGRSRPAKGGRAASNGVDNGSMLALSDLRRFAKVLCGKKEEILNLPELQSLGPEPLNPQFTFKKFKELFNPPAGGKRGRIKPLLMTPNFISGIGNIYADEILWFAKIHPAARAEKLKEAELKKIYQAIKIILRKALKLRGSSIDDYRDGLGRRGSYDLTRYVYQREDEPCKRCGAKIKRLKLAGRSAHFCPACQRLKP